jgi:dephospho-CoA kinase
MKLAFTGGMGSGKTTLAQKWVDDNYGVKLAFGDALKTDILKYNLVNGKIDKVRDRALMQSYGQLRRNELFKVPFFNGVILNIDSYAYAEYDCDTNFMPFFKREYLGRCSGDHWVNVLLDKVKTQFDQLIVVDDIRRENELVALKDLGFTTVKITCDDAIRFERLRTRDGGLNMETLNDISETEIDKLMCDFVIDNSDSFEKSYLALCGSVNPILF